MNIKADPKKAEVEATDTHHPEEKKDEPTEEEVLAKFGESMAKSAEKEA